MNGQGQYSAPRRSLSTVGRRVEWLLGNPKLWERYPSRAGHDLEIVRALQEAGLLSRKTLVNQVNVGNLVAMARARRKERAWSIPDCEPDGSWLERKLDAFREMEAA